MTTATATKTRDGFYVYEIVFTGSMGSQRLGSLWLHRSQAKAEVRRRRAEWADLERSGQGSIFGDMKIERAEVIGRMLL